MKSNNQILFSDNLTIGYLPSKKKNPIVVHKNLSFSLNEGELTCLLGSNGAGKSTLLKTISGIIPPLSGNIYLKDRSILDYSIKEYSTLISIVLTGRTFAGGLTVREVLALGRYPYTGYFGKLSTTDNQIIDRVLFKTGIIEFQNRLTSDLSDGEHQKVMIAKALAQECPIIILDEPTAFLDISSKLELSLLLKDLARSEHKTILMTSHDLETALRISDNLWLLHRNKPMIQGKSEQLIQEGYINEYFDTDRVRFNRSTFLFEF